MIAKTFTCYFIQTLRDHGNATATMVPVVPLVREPPHPRHRPKNKPLVRKAGARQRLVLGERQVTFT
jgi:hypothetical protein